MAKKKKKDVEEVSRKQYLTYLGACIAISFAIYGATIGNFFVSDDFNIVASVKDATYIGIFTDFGSIFYRPLLYAIHKLNFSLFGLNTIFFSIVWIMLNALNGFLLFLICKKVEIFKKHAELASIIFVTHFSHIEAVAWYSSSDVMMTFFILLSMYFHINRKLHLSSLFFVFSLLSKETAVIFLPIIVFFDLFAFDRSRLWKGKSYYLSYLVVLIVYFILRYNGITAASGGNYSFRFGFNIIRNYSYLFSAMVLPFNFYEAGEILKQAGLMGLFKNMVWMPLSIFLVFIGYIVMFIKVRETRKFLILFAISFLPVAFLGGSGERFLYLPSVFFVLTLVLLVGKYEIVRSVIVLFFIIMVFLLNIKWRAASNYVKTISEQILERRGQSITTVYIVDPIDNIKGAYALRNGADKLGALLTDGKIETIGISSEELLSSEIESEGVSFIYHVPDE